MTSFKHMKFGDSSTMRSLEKLAISKGWGIEAPIHKIASLAKKDLSISLNLTENILKLCSGLRTSGLEKYADDVEHKFMSYKSAQTLYETSKETGEDLIDAAHPEGSHKMKDIAGDATIETIIDQHLAGLKMVKKNPTGKLFSYKEIMFAVKTALSVTAAKDTTKIKQNLLSLSNIIQTIFNLHEEESFLTRPIVWGKDTLLNLIADVSSKIDSSDVTPSLPRIKYGLDIFYEKFHHILTTGSNEQIWAGMVPLFTKAYAIFDEIKTAIESPEEVKTDTSKSDTLSKWIANSFAVLKGWQAKISTDPSLNARDKKSAGDWIINKQNLINNVNMQFNDFSPEEKEANADNLLANLKKITTPSFADFKKEWID